MIELISNFYGENIILFEGLQEIKNKIPEELFALLKESNGIMETMKVSEKDKIEKIGWIVYPLNMILQETEFFMQEYAVKGTVFADDGAGNPYYIKADGGLYLFEVIDNEEIFVAGSMEEFFSGDIIKKS